MYKDENKKKEYHKNYHQKYKPYRRCLTNRYRQLKYQAFQIIKPEFKCPICGENEPVCIDLHHLDEKMNDVKSFADIILRKCWGVKKIVEEMNKCAPVCSNCHRKITHNVIIVDLEPFRLNIKVEDFDKIYQELVISDEELKKCQKLK